MSHLKIDNIPDAVRTIKHQLRRQLPHYREVFAELDDEMRRQIHALKDGQQRGEHPVPEVDANDILNNRVTEQQKNRIRQRGCCTVRGVFPRAQATQWNTDIGHYLDDNAFVEKLKNAAEDNYFGNLKQGKPQIYGVYWSQPQVQARQDARMQSVQVFLNSLWQTESAGEQHFDPTRIVSYADRIRRRPLILARWACRRTLMAAHWSAGWMRISVTFTAMCLAETGSNIIRLTPKGGPACASSPLPPSAQCSVRSRAGRR